MESAILRITTGFCAGFIPSVSEVEKVLFILLFFVKNLSNFSIMS